MVIFTIILAIWPFLWVKSLFLLPHPQLCCTFLPALPINHNPRNVNHIFPLAFLSLVLALQFNSSSESSRLFLLLNCGLAILLVMICSDLLVWLLCYEISLILICSAFSLEGRAFRRAFAFGIMLILSFLSTAGFIFVNHTILPFLALLFRHLR